MWQARAEKASARRTERAKPAPALTLAGHGVSLHIENGALTIENGFTHYPQQREIFRYFRGDLSLPERIILIDGSGSVSFDVLSWLAEQKVSGFSRSLSESWRRNARSWRASASSSWRATIWILVMRGARRARTLATGYAGRRQAAPNAAFRQKLLMSVIWITGSQQFRLAWRRRAHDCDRRLPGVG
jgi:hypothetical protein